MISAWKRPLFGALLPLFFSLACGSGGDGASSSVCEHGPNGWCWWMFANPPTSAAWVAPPSASAAHVFLTAPAGSENVGSAGVGFSMATDAQEGAPPPAIDLGGFDRIVFTATANTGFEFAVTYGAYKDNCGCSTNFSGSGTRQTYTFEFGRCSRFNADASKPDFTFARADAVHWNTVWGQVSSLDLQIVPDVLFCTGSECTTNPLGAL